MRVKLTAAARNDLRAYFYHIASENPRAADRERKRVLTELIKFAAAPVDGPAVRVESWPRAARCWIVHPFRVYYERVRHEDIVVVFRLHHHARRPIER